MTLTLEQFAATRTQPIAEDTWHAMLEEGAHIIEGSTTNQLMQAQYAGSYVITKLHGQYYVHAWWYAPIAYEDQATAEAKLYEWYKEWQ